MALEFESGDGINCGNDTSLDMPTAFTVTTWIYPTGYSSGYGFIVVKYATTDRNYSLYILNNKLAWNIAANARSDGPSISTNEWAFVAWTAFNPNGQIIMYKNGVQHVASISENVDYSFPTGNGDFRIGRRSDGYGMLGKIGEVVIYDRVLSPGEIMNAYTRRHIPDSNTKGCWRLDEGAFNLAPGGTDCVDISDNGNNGVEINTPVYVDGPPMQWNQGD